MGCCQWRLGRCWIRAVKALCSSATSHSSHPDSCCLHMAFHHLIAPHCTTACLLVSVCLLFCRSVSVCLSALNTLSLVHPVCASLSASNHCCLCVCVPLQVRLLLGEIPERGEFSAPGMREPLTPYFELTCAVRSGDLATFR